MKKLATLATAAMLSFGLAMPASAVELDTVIDAEHRQESAKRDEYRHPQATLDFFEIKPDMTVVEIWPGGSGWYTEILAPYLRDAGTLYTAHVNPKAGDYYKKSRAQFEKKLTSEPERYDHVKITTFDPPKLIDIAPEGSADRVLTFRNIHNWYQKGGGDERVLAAFQAFYKVLKPGGMLGVVEHRLPADQDKQSQEASGYMHQAYVVDMAKKAGFELVEASEINANPKDKANHPDGVWSLPPGLRAGEKNRDKYQAIGESDRMTLKFKKAE